MIDSSIRNFEFARKVITNRDLRFKTTAKAAQELADNGYGSFSKGYFSFDPRTQQHLKDWLKSMDIDWTKKLETGKSRTDMAGQSIYEKKGAKTVKKNWVKLKAGTSGCKLNGKLIDLPDNTHLEFEEIELKSLDINELIIVENLDTFRDFRKELIEGMVPATAILYRGDRDDTRTIKLPDIKKLITKNTPSYVIYGDFDPAGIEISISMNCDGMILPDLNHIRGLKGNAALYSDQHHQLARIEDKGIIPSSILPWVEYLKEAKQGFTQERMTVKSIPQLRIQISK
jgi:hypothetical protein